MDTKLILKLDREVIARAEEYAHSQKMSLSQLIENYLNAVTKQTDSNPKISPFVKGITGGDKITDNREWKELREDYIDYLEKKYK